MDVGRNRRDGSVEGEREREQGELGKDDEVRGEERDDKSCGRGGVLGGGREGEDDASVATELERMWKKSLLRAVAVTR